MYKGPIETSRHFFFNYLAFARLWLRHIDIHTFGEPREITEFVLGRLNNTVTDSRRFADL